MRARSRLGLGLGVALAGAAATRMVRRRRSLIDRVAVDLRSPLLYLPMDVTSAAVLRVGRLATSAPTRVAPGVTLARRMVPAAVAGEPPASVFVYDSVGRVRPSGAFIWIHGGGLIMGDPRQGHAHCSELAQRLGIVVVSVDYRLAPEAPFPAGLEDCYAALAWVHREREALGIDPTRIAVGGDSAGGGLAATVAQVARDRGEVPVCFQLLVYPMLDDRTVLRADDDGRGDLIWTASSNRFAWTAYLGHAPTIGAERPFASASRCDDLRGLPPAWIGVGDLDLFYEEDLLYADGLRGAGVACEVRVEPGMYHAANVTRPKAPRMQAFRSEMIEALRSALDGG